MLKPVSSKVVNRASSTHDARSAFIFMKTLLAAFLVALASGTAHARTSSSKPPAHVLASQSAPREAPSSWLFLLESQTQWWLLIQEQPDVLALKEINPRAATTSDTLAAGTSGTGFHSGTAGNSTSSGSLSNPSTSSFVIEGDTRDLPLLPDPTKPPSPGPSAPSS